MREYLFARRDTSGLTAGSGAAFGRPSAFQGLVLDISESTAVIGGTVTVAHTSTLRPCRLCKSGRLTVAVAGMMARPLLEAMNATSH